ARPMRGLSTAPAAVGPTGRWQRNPFDRAAATTWWRRWPGRGATCARPRCLSTARPALARPTGAPRRACTGNRPAASMVSTWLLPRAPAAVDEKGRARDERGFVADEIDDRRRNLLRPPHASQGLRGGHFAIRGFGIGILLQARRDKGRLHATRAHTVDAHSLGRMVERHGLGHADDRELRRAVGQAIADADNAA